MLWLLYSGALLFKDVDEQVWPIAQRAPPPPPPATPYSPPMSRRKVCELWLMHGSGKPVVECSMGLPDCCLVLASLPGFACCGACCRVAT